MDLPTCIPVLTDAALPLLGERQAAVYLAACGVLGGIIALLAHLARIDGGGDSWRRLRFLGLVLLPLGLWRGLLWGSLGGSMPVLVASCSVQAILGSWQVAQEIVPSLLSRLSK